MCTGSESVSDEMRMFLRVNGLWIRIMDSFFPSEGLQLKTHNGCIVIIYEPSPRLAVQKIPSMSCSDPGQNKGLIMHWRCWKIGN